MVEVMKIMQPPSKGPMYTLLHSVPQPYSRPPPTYASAGDSCTLMCKSGSVSFGVTAPFFWVLVCTRFCVYPPRICFSALCKFGSSIVGLMATSSKRVYAILRSAEPRAPVPWQSTANLYLHRRHSNTVLAQSLWGRWVLLCTKFV